jgi:hypothetical protein
MNEPLHVTDSEFEKVVLQSTLLTCSLLRKNPNFDLKFCDLGTLRAVPDTLELRYGIHSESQNLQWGDRGSDRL